MTEYGMMTCNHTVRPNGVGSDILLSWNYAPTHLRNLTQTAFELTASYQPGMNEPFFSSGRVESGSMCFRLTDKTEVSPMRRIYWRVRSELSDGSDAQSGTEYFDTGIFDNNTWKENGCRWLTCRTSKKNMPAAPEFSRNFRLPVKKAVARASAYVFAAGFSLFTVNGETPDDRILAPSNSVYEKHCIYESYDIKPLLRPGSNTVAVRCGSGYDETYSKWGFRYFGKKGFIALIVIEFSSGEKLVVPSDTSWRCFESHVRECSIYGGEVYDATLVEPHRFPVTSDDAKAPWMPDGKLVPREVEQIGIIRTDTPASVAETDAGLLFDFGENSAALVRITVNAPSGTAVTLRHSEMINPDGTQDFYTNRGANATDVYICAGGTETYMPRFTYHCFRYVAVEGLPSADCLIKIEKCLLSTDLRTDGSFESSDAMLNAIHGLMITGIRSNLFSIPTDCAVRDERTPCEMDSQAIEKAVMCNFGAAAYYTKWLRDCIDCNKPDSKPNPDWKGDMVSLMWRIYRFYGDLRPAEKYFDTAQALFFDMLERTEDGVYHGGFGDWCNPNENTWESFFGSVSAVNTSLLFSMGKKLAILGEALGRPDAELEKLEAGSQKVLNGFLKQCVNADGSFFSEKQTELSMPVYEGLASGKTAEAALELLVKKLEADPRADIGIFGAMSLFDVLANAGKTDLALQILRGSEYPGYGFLLAKGATSLWEQWRYKGKMDSHSHGMFAGPDAMFYSVFGGLVCNAPGFEKIAVCPVLPDGLDWVRISRQTPFGLIKVFTRKLCGGVEIMLTVPVGCTAAVVFPELDGETEYAFFDGEKPIEYRDYLIVGSGIYDFRCVPARLQQDH